MLTEYVITEYSGLPKRFAVDRRERDKDGRIHLVNVAWCDTIDEAYEERNNDWERRNEHDARKSNGRA